VELAKYFKIPLYKLNQPCIICNVDGTKNSRGSIDTATMLMINYNNQITEHTFYHIDLGDDHMLLSMPFLATTNPNIDWTNGTFEGKVIATTKDAHKWSPHDHSKPIFVFPEEHPDCQHYEPHLSAYCICTSNQIIMPSLMNLKNPYTFVEPPNLLLLLPKQWTRPNIPGRSKSHWNTIALARFLVKKSLRDFLEVVPGIMLSI
jgi:hypothetical protein